MAERFSLTVLEPLIVALPDGEPFVAEPPRGHQGPHWILFTSPERLLSWSKLEGLRFVVTISMTPALLDRARRGGIGLITDPRSDGYGVVDPKEAFFGSMAKGGST